MHRDHTKSAGKSESPFLGLRPWACRTCGYIVHAVDWPTPRTWSDGHTCTFERYQPVERKAGDFAGRKGNVGSGTQAYLPFG